MKLLISMPRLGWLGLVLGLALASPTAPGAVARELTADETAIVKLLHDYVESFAGKEATEIAGYYHVPSSVVYAGGVVVMVSTLEVARFVNSVQRNLAEQGYTRSEWIQLHVKQMSAKLALASTAVIHYNGDDEVLAESGTTYVFRKTDEGWKIATLLLHDPDAVLSLQ